MSEGKEILTKSGKPISQETFGTLVGKDKICRHAAVDLDLYNSDLRLLGRYLHYCGYRTLEEVRDLLVFFARDGKDPFVEIQPKFGKVIDFKEWKYKKGIR